MSTNDNRNMMQMAHVSGSCRQHL